MDIQPGKTKYYIYITTEDGTVLNVTRAVNALSWEDNEKELSMRVSFSVYNAKIDDGRRIGAVIAIGQAVTVKAQLGSGTAAKKAAEAFIKDIEHNDSASADTFSIIAYDVLFNMQKSQDNVYFTAGKMTESAIRTVLGEWGVTVGTYNGPNVAHSEILYRNKHISDIVLGILDEAVKKGGCKAVIRADGTTVSVIRKGSNQVVYCLDAQNVISSKYKLSIVSMVTRVKVVASGKDEGAPPVEAVVDGRTEFGILQRIMTHASSDSLEDAKKAAQETLDTNGEPAVTMTVQAPDVPMIRKGDLVNVNVGLACGDYVVKSIQHNATAGRMTLDLEKWEEEPAGGQSDVPGTQPGTYKAGDVVHFKGGTQYVSSYSDAAGYPASAGPATIIIAGGSGGAHPWSLATTDWKGTNPVYGWVDDGTFD